MSFSSGPGNKSFCATKTHCRMDRILSFLCGEATLEFSNSDKAREKFLFSIGLLMCLLGKELQLFKGLRYKYFLPK